MIYHDQDWPHGMRCSGCDKLFQEGDQVWHYPHGMIDEIPVLEPRCDNCMDQPFRKDTDEP